MLSLQRSRRSLVSIATLSCRGKFGVNRSMSSANAQTTSAYDIVVSGGGSVSTAFLASLYSRLSGSIPVGATNSDFQALRVLLIENRPEPAIAGLQKSTQSATPDLRVFALSRATVNFLQSSGSWSTALETRSQPYSQMKISEIFSKASLTFDCDDVNESNLGLIAEDAVIQAALYKRLEDFKNMGLELTFGSQITDISRKLTETDSSDDLLSVTYKSGTGESHTIKTRLLIGGDGGNSTVRKLCDISTKGRTYCQDGVVATIKLDKDQLPAKVTAYQRYLETGPLGLLPLPNAFASIVWSMPSSKAKEVVALSPDVFMQRLNEALQQDSHSLRTHVLENDDTKMNNTEDSNSSSSFDWSIFMRSGPFQSNSNASDPFPIRVLDQLLKVAVRGPLNRLKTECESLVDTALNAAEIRGVSDVSKAPRVVEIVSARVGFPLQLQHARRYCSHRMALIGDAAHSIHPHAGQGLNLGFGDAKELADLVWNSLSTGGDIGSKQVLDKYEKIRYPINQVMLQGVDAIHRLFEAESGVSPEFDKWRHIVRSLGMRGINSIPQLRKLIVQYAMGLNRQDQDQGHNNQ